MMNPSRHAGGETAALDVPTIVHVAGGDDFVDGFAKLGRFVRFRDNAAETEILVATHGRVGGVTAGDNGVHGGIDLDQFL